MAVAASLLLYSLIVAPLIFLLHKFILFYADFHRRRKYIRKLPGPPPHWLWGHVHHFPGPNEEGLLWLRDRAAENPRGSKTFYGPFEPAMGLFHPENVKAVLKTSEPKPLRFGGYKNIKSWLGEGLLISGGKKWARNRRLLTPAFHFDILKPYMEVYNKTTDVILAKMDKFHEEDTYYELFTHISQLTLDILLRCAFSYDNDCQIRGNNHPYVKAVMEMCTSAVSRILNPLLYPDIIYFNLSSSGRQFKRNADYVHKISEDIIRKRRKALESQSEHTRNRKYLDFLDILLTAKDEDGQGLSDIDIRDEADTFLFEGHDTTASGISWTLYSIAKNPEIQRKCQEEIDEVLNGRSSDYIMWDDLSKLTYLTLCIKEALRLHVPVPIIERELTKEMVIDGYTIPAGTIVDVHLWNLHHNQEIWGDDDLEFKPERMLSENMQKKDAYAYLPFSAGPRNCIGQHFAMHEMKTVIARILHRYFLELDPDHEVRRQIVVVMKTENGIMIKGKPRSKGRKEVNNGEGHVKINGVQRNGEINSKVNGIK